MSATDRWLAIGGLWRLLGPGPNAIGPFRTAFIGVTDSFLGGLVARYATGLHCRYSLLAGFVLAVIFAAIIVAAIDRRPSARR